MQNDDAQAQGVNDEGVVLPPQVQWQNDQVQNDGPVKVNPARETNFFSSKSS